MRGSVAKPDWGKRMVMLHRPLVTPLVSGATVLVLAKPVEGPVPVYVTGKLTCSNCFRPTSDLDAGVIVGYRTPRGAYLPLGEGEPHPQGPRLSGPNIHAATPKAVCPHCGKVEWFPLDIVREIADQAFHTVDPQGHMDYHSDTVAYLRRLLAHTPVASASADYCLDEDSDHLNYLG